MARDQAKSNIKINLQQPPVPKSQGKRPRGIKQQQAVRKSLRLQAIRQSYKQSLYKNNHIQEVQAPLSPPASNIPEGRQRPQTLHKPSTSFRNGNEDKENEKLDIPHLESKSSLLGSDCEPPRRVTSARAALTRSSTGSRLESGEKSTSSKTASVFSFPLPLHKTRPQPDFSVGFGRSAFTQEQLNKLKPFVGEPGSKVITYFMATTRMYFPFLTCEVKCGAAALDIADRQNAHSMTVAVRALGELFRSVKRGKELDLEILAFFISHDHRFVRIYGHYPLIEEDKTTFYRHPIHEFSFMALDGKEKWTAYKFTKDVYDAWMPILYTRICSAIEALPAGINFDLSQSAYFSQSTP
ncbi:MAG: hypothetical protein Q9171_004798 [Xanthocarpia ochracea]